MRFAEMLIMSHVLLYRPIEGCDSMILYQKIHRKRSKLALPILSMKLKSFEELFLMERQDVNT
jgi:hypothetical protein